MPLACSTEANDAPTLVSGLITLPELAPGQSQEQSLLAPHQQNVTPGSYLLLAVITAAWSDWESEIVTPVPS